jgi:hypothetical protein
VVAYASQHTVAPAACAPAERSFDARRHSIVSMNLPRKVATADEPFKHVIAEYRVREHFVACVCGWSGNAPGKVSSPDDWNAHLLAVRGRRR